MIANRVDLFCDERGAGTRGFSTHDLRRIDPTNPSPGFGMRVLLVDDHPAMRYGVRYLLDAAEGLEAVRLARELRSDLVLLDLCLEGEDSGIEACREIKGARDAPLVVLFTAHTGAEDVAAAVLAGADGYLCQGHAGGEFGGGSSARRGGREGVAAHHGQRGGARARRGRRRRGAAHAQRAAKSSRSCSGATRTPRSPRSCI